jgi:hypothetical protein
VVRKASTLTECGYSNRYITCNSSIVCTRLKGTNTGQSGDDRPVPAQTASMVWPGLTVPHCFFPAPLNKCPIPSETHSTHSAMNFRWLTTLGTLNWMTPQCSCLNGFCTWNASTQPCCTVLISSSMPVLLHSLLLTIGVLCTQPHRHLQVVVLTNSTTNGFQLNNLVNTTVNKVLWWGQLLFQDSILAFSWRK